jgi:hypothetical protein
LSDDCSTKLFFFDKYNIRSILITPFKSITHHCALPSLCVIHMLINYCFFFVVVNLSFVSLIFWTTIREPEMNRGTKVFLLSYNVIQASFPFFLY